MIEGVTRLLGTRAHALGRDDAERSQALLRLGIVSVGLAYSAWVAARSEASLPLWTINLAALLFAAVLVAIIARRPEPSPARRIAGAVHDNVLVTLWLLHAGPIGALFLFVY